MNRKNNIYLFFLGALCFTISQILLRIPLLNILNNNFSFQKIQILYPIIHILFLSFSAGVFEEGFRFIFRKYLVKFNNKTNNAIIFGLGHGLVEVAYLFSGMFVTRSYISGLNLAISIYERILAVIFHVGMTVVIWRGFKINKRWQNLLIAILSHGLFNSIAVLLGSSGAGLFVTYTVLTIYCIIILIYIKRVKKLEENYE